MKSVLSLFMALCLSLTFALDAHAKRIPDPEKLGAALKDIAGVVEHGLFIGLSQVVIIGKAKGAEVKTL